MFHRVVVSNVCQCSKHKNNHINNRAGGTCTHSSDSTKYLLQLLVNGVSGRPAAGRRVEKEAGNGGAEGLWGWREIYIHTYRMA